MSSQFELKNSHLNDKDVLYHLGLKANDDLLSLFGDVKFVCLGGKASRMEKFASALYEWLGEPGNSYLEDDTGMLKDISADAGRYSMFKVGEVLVLNHGIGMASLSVALNEVFKLLYHAKCGKDIKFIRIGSSGGLGVEPGTLVVTNQPLSSTLERKFRCVSLGEKYSLPCPTSAEMRSKLLEIAKKKGIPVISGNTVSTDDFFEGQCRLDGAFCDYNREDKMKFLKTAHDEYGVRNFEMESSCLAAMCNRAGLECAVICTTLVDRLKTDAVDVSGKEIAAWEERLCSVVKEYISRELEKK